MSGPIMALSAPATSPAVLQLIASTYEDSQITPEPALSYFTLYNTGAATGGVTVASGSGSYNWLTGALASLYEVSFSLNVGTFSSGPVKDVWHNKGLDG